jgi:RND family efflux transporter MFP subunit
MKKLFVPAFILGIWLLQACSSSEGKNSKATIPADEIPVSVIKLEKSGVQSTMQAAGQFTTDDETYLSFKTGGVIDKIFVKEGDAIHKGQLLATLNFTEINAQVSQARLGFEKASRDFDRVTNLYKDSVATLEQYQNAKTGLDVASQQYDAVKFNRSYSEIRALSNGFVLRKMANEGQVIQSATNVFQTNGASKGKWMLKTGVSDREWSKISLNDKAAIYTDGSPDKPLTAYVSRKSEGVDAATGSFTIELTLTGKLPVSLASGMFGKALITAAQSVNAWSIPYEALLDGNAQSGYVFVTDDMKTARKANVTISEITHDHVIVTSGLENAQAIVVAGSAYLRDQSPIRIVDK